MSGEYVDSTRFVISSSFSIYLDGRHSEAEDQLIVWVFLQIFSSKEDGLMQASNVK
jgi:hypothetical protein